MEDDWTGDIYTAKCRSVGHPRPMYLKIRMRRGGDYQPAELRHSIPLDPETGEVLDRALYIDAYINGHSANVEHVWSWGQQITREEFKWLTAITAIRTMRL